MLVLIPGQCASQTKCILLNVIMNNIGLLGRADVHGWYRPTFIVGFYYEGLHVTIQIDYSNTPLAVLFI